MENKTGFRTAERSSGGFVFSLEKRLLVWLATRLPAWVSSDQLTALGFVSLISVGASYWYARSSPRNGFLLAILFLALNWFGDSLDGTVARVRNQQRPRYGFYIDHVLDAIGSVCLFAGLALSGYMSPLVATGLLVVYLLLSIETYLATHVLGKFHMSFAAFGPTELRLLLIAANVSLLIHPNTRLFDIGGSIGIAGMAVALIWNVATHGVALYRAETPRRNRTIDWPGMLRRWGKFNVVGFAGFVLQLAVLWALARLGMPYLLATAFAVELALLHNFVWHETWTWKGLAIAGRWRRLARFHLANGFVSIVSNVVFTWALMQIAHLPLLMANAGAVLMAALLNFVLATRWVFSYPVGPEGR